jgi:hypothetical protein
MLSKPKSPFPLVEPHQRLDTPACSPSPPNIRPSANTITAKHAEISVRHNRKSSGGFANVRRDEIERLLRPRKYRNAEIDEFIDSLGALREWSPAALSIELRLTLRERADLGIRTIEACDVTHEIKTNFYDDRRRNADRLRKAIKRNNKPRHPGKRISQIDLVEDALKRDGGSMTALEIANKVQGKAPFSGL